MNMHNHNHPSHGSALIALNYEHAFRQHTLDVYVCTQSIGEDI
eukprot:COSAG06_NODE_5828_length_3254_cov_1.507765_3_plen_43_part_00